MIILLSMFLDPLLLPQRVVQTVQVPPVVVLDHAAGGRYHEKEPLELLVVAVLSIFFFFLVEFLRKRSKEELF